MVDGTQIKFLSEHLLNAGAHVRVVAIPRQVHHGGNKPVEPVSAQEQAGLAALLQAHDAAERIGQIISGSVQQLQARVILQGTQKRLVRVRTGVVAKAAAHHRNTLTHQRSLNSGQRIRLASEQAQDDVLANHAAIQVEAAHTNVVQVVVACDGGAGVRLRDVQRAREQSALQGLTRERNAALTLRGAQNTERRTGAVHQRNSAGGAVQYALLHAHEHKVAAGEPAQEVLCHLHAGGGLHAARVGGVGFLAVAQGCATQVVHGLRQVENAGDHGVQVGVAGANVSEDALHFLLAAALIFLSEVAGQADRNPGLNSDRGALGGVIAELEGGHAKSGGIAAGKVAAHAGAAQAQEVTVRAAFGEESGVKNRDETTKVRGEACGQGADDVRHVVGCDVQGGVVLVIACGNDRGLGQADLSQRTVGASQIL